MTRHRELEPPPLGASLEAELRDLKPVSTRRPWRDVVFVSFIAAVAIAGMVVFLRVRRDFDALPTAWLVAYGAAWLVGFAGGAWLALVPRRGAVVPRWFAAGVLGAIVGAGFVVAGLVFARTTAHSLVYDPTAGNHLRYAAGCVALGVATAVLPFVAGALLLRGAFPVGARAAGAGLGAACGAAGGFMLHLHCPITHAYHLGFGHGGAVVAGALLGALLLPFFAREKAR
jgi:hypothetical protein